jgi:hypothetical protein
MIPDLKVVNYPHYQPLKHYTEEEKDGRFSRQYPAINFADFDQFAA